MVSSNFFDYALDDVALKHERKAIGETAESRIRGLESLRKKLLQIDNLNPRLDDDFLLRFLRVAKYDTKKACERIQKYYSVRKTYSHVLKDFYPSAAKTALRTSYFLACPRKTADHSTVFILKRGMYNPTSMVYEEVVLMDCLLLDYMSENPFTQVCGAHAILDLAGYSFQHFINDTPSRVRMAIDIMQNSFPLRYKSIHIVNVPQIFSFLYNLCYPFLTKKIKKRLHLHNGNDDWKNLHSILPPEILPLDYGGKIPNSDLIDLTDEIVEKDSQYKEQLKYGFVKNM